MLKKDLEQQSNSCEVCKETCHKYKCPSCNTKYCSLSCFKIHKGDLCERETNRRKEETERKSRAVSHSQKETEEGEVTDSGSDEKSDSEDRISGRILEKLGQSQELHSMLHNKHLREMITEVDSSEDPGKLLGQAMQIPIFTEFVDECLRIVEPQDETEMVH
ncbi:Zinc finger HIT domain-containing protein 3 [Desmophyllum pertusum]|uniref:Zinc finger HIT domain-containing protein 3 n=1 Tax=Desmophyllum pertusum TaxID=174260 RepID=A0A9W9ZT80_9CNID|nr:Zinc finger HIT domain-containing protein 3 [Desmophyllum pertusum]